MASDTGDAVFILVFGAAAVAVVFCIIVWQQVRFRKQIRAAAGPDAIRVRLRANRRGYTAGLVPVLEELLQRVEHLEAKLSVKRHDG